MTIGQQPQRTVVFREGGRGAYALLNHLIAPRAIAWVTSRSESGTDNAAPHSYATVVSTDPPVVAFTSLGHKDTLTNVRHLGEFVVCGVSRQLREQANISGAPFPPDVSEFDRAGLTREPSLTVAPYRIGESPFAIECRLRHIIAVGNGNIVLGDVTCVAVREDSLVEGRVATQAMDLVSRCGGDDWFALGEHWQIKRVTELNL